VTNLYTLFILFVVAYFTNTFIIFKSSLLIRMTC